MHVRVCVCVCSYLQPQLQRHLEQRDVGQAVHERGDLERVLGQLEDVRGRVDVLLDGLEHRLEFARVACRDARHQSHTITYSTV